jgi:hypothetical protein
MQEKNIFNPEEDTLRGWITQKAQSWRNHYESNYKTKHEEYYRIWRCIWSGSDSLRESERSKIVSPATQQAVESAISEIEEATFGRGAWFDLQDDTADKNKEDIEVLRKKLIEDMTYAKARKSICDVITISAVYGTGIGEIVVDNEESLTPASRPMLDGEIQQVGVEKKERFVVRVNPILPQNFLMDPNSETIDKALGVAIDKFVPRHEVEQMITKGVYRDVPVFQASPDSDIEPDQDLTLYSEDKVRLTKYYGLVPKRLLENELAEREAEEEGKEVKPEKEDEEDSDRIEEGLFKKAEEYEEAIVIVMNDGVILKAERSPYMMKDRPVIAFNWDIVPGKFWGRGIVEKGYHPQKALDTELRARIDALALLIHPMLAVDSTRIPRGSNLTIKPGKILLTTGDPSQILQPFKMGNLEQLSFTQSNELQRMVQMATGALDMSGMPEMAAGGNAKTGAMSMALGGIIKRHKRTLINFQDSFLVPFIEKAAWRYMQFNPEEYPVKDFKFIASSTLGIVAREFETSQLVTLLQTTGPDTPFFPIILEKIIENMQVSNRDELIAQIKQMQQPNPEAKQQEQMQQQAEMEKFKAEMEKLQIDTKKVAAEARKILVETQLLPQEVQAKLVAALSTNLEAGEGDDREFERRLKVAEMALKEEDIKSNERIVDAQLRNSKEIATMKAKKEAKDDSKFQDLLGG